MDFSASVRPACGLDQRATFAFCTEQPVITAVRISLKNATIPAKMLLRMFTLPVR
ncbi:hypothetical protein D3C86_1451450 [compost metagenome]